MNDGNDAIRVARYAANLDPSKYVAGAKQVEDANRRMSGSTGKVHEELTKVTNRSVVSASAIERLHRQVDSGYRAQQRYERQVRLVNQALSDGTITMAKHQQVLAAVEAQHRKLNQTMESGSVSFGNFNRILAAVGTYLGGRQLAEYADSWALLKGRVDLVTDSYAQQVTVEKELQRVARETQSSYGDTVNLYARVARNASELGVSQREIIRFGELVQKSLLASGATAQEAAGGVLQLSQGLAAGRLMGEEFRSVMENMPALAQAIAQSMGVSIGSLRELSREGELTTEKIISGVLKMQDRIEEQVGTVPQTIARSFVYMDNALQQLIGRAAEVSGLGKLVSDSIRSIADSLVDEGTIYQVTDWFTKVKDFILFLKENQEIIIMLTGILGGGLRGGLPGAAIGGVGAFALNQALKPDPTILQELEDLQKQLKALEETGLGGGLRADRLRERYAQTLAEVIQLNQEVEEYRLSVEMVGQASLDLVKKTEALDPVSQRLIENAKKATEELRIQADAERRLAEARGDGLQAYEDMQRTLEVEENLRKLGTAATEEQKQAVIRYTREIQEAKKKVEDLNDAERKREESLWQAAKDAKDRMDQAQRSIKDTLSEFDRTVGEDAKRAAKIMQEPFRQAARNIYDSFSDMFYDVFDKGIKGFDDFAKRIFDVFKRLAAEITAIMVIRSTFVGSAVSSIGGGSLARELGLNVGAAAVGGGIAGSLGLGAGGALATHGGLALAGAAPWLAGGAALIFGLSKLFGNNQPSNKAAGAEYDFMTGKFLSSSAGDVDPKKANPEGLKAVTDAINSITAVAQQIADISGGRATGKISIVTGERDGTQVTVGGKTTTVRSVEEAMNVVIDGMLQGIEGARPEFQRIIEETIGQPAEQRLKALEKYANRVALVDSIDDQILEMTDPTAYKIKVLDKEFAALRKTADELGLSQEERVKIETLYAMKLKEITRTIAGVVDTISKLNADIDAEILDLRDPQGKQLRGFSATLSSNLKAGADPGKAIELFALSAQTLLPTIAEQQATIDRARIQALTEEEKKLDQLVGRRDRGLSGLLNSINRLTLGPLSPLSPSDRYAYASSRFSEVSTRAQAGDLDAIEQLPTIIDEFLTESRGMFASSEAYARDWERARGVLENTKSIQQTLLTIEQQELSELRAIRAAVEARQPSAASPGTRQDGITRFNDLQNAFQSYHDSAKSQGWTHDQIYSNAGAKALSDAMSGVYGAIEDNNWLMSRFDALKPALSSGIASMASLATDQMSAIRAVLQSRGIQGFAKGGIVRRPTLAMIGEGGQDEAVVPLENGSIPVRVNQEELARIMKAGMVSNDSLLTEVLSELRRLNAKVTELEQAAQRRAR